MKAEYQWLERLLEGGLMAMAGVAIIAAAGMAAFGTPAAGVVAVVLVTIVGMTLGYGVSSDGGFDHV